MKVKMVTVKDEGTRPMNYFVMKPDKEEEWEAYRDAGWGDEPLLIVRLGIGGYASAVISNFHYPPYDINERSRKMELNGTNLYACTLIARKGFDNLPRHITEEEMETERKKDARV
jgi:hypothetical protein